MRLSLNTAERKEAVIRLILLLVNIGIATAIFMFSAQPADVSGDLSNDIVYKVIKATFSMTKIPDSRITEWSLGLNGIARKLAHFLIYMFFSISMNLFLSRFHIKRKNVFLIGILICLIYAISDEIHQFFVPGRSCELRDVCIDFCGILFGIALILIIKGLKEKFKKV